MTDSTQSVKPHIHNKNNAVKVNLQEILEAQSRIKDSIVKTPCVKAHFSAKCHMEVYLKCEFMQYTGCFKERGDRNCLMLLGDHEKKNGVITASTGNHAQAVSYHGNKLGIPVKVVMPEITPLTKKERCKALGGRYIIHGQNMEEAHEYAMKLSQEKDYFFLNGFDHPDVIAGQGTIGLEVMEQVPDVDAVLVPVGGGGLLAGILIAIKNVKPNVLVYGVETDRTASMTGALKAGHPIYVDTKDTLADGLGVPRVGINAFHNIKPLLDGMVVVTEDWTARAILNVAENEKFIMEGAGAVATAAVLSGSVPQLHGKKVVCICSGGNIDTTMLSRCMARGLVAEYRLVKFKVNVSDRPGGLAELCRLLAKMPVAIKDVQQQRAWLEGNMYKVQIKMTCEIAGFMQREELRKELEKYYPEVTFINTDRIANDKVQNWDKSNTD